MKTKKQTIKFLKTRVRYLDNLSHKVFMGNCTSFYPNTVFGWQNLTEQLLREARSSRSQQFELDDLISRVDLTNPIHASLGIFLSE
jgi:hypothetical protein